MRYLRELLTDSDDPLTDVIQNDLWVIPCNMYAVLLNLKYVITSLNHDLQNIFVKFIWLVQHF